MIRKRGEEYVLVSKTTGKVLGRHKTRAGAARQERAVQARKHASAARYADWKPGDVAVVPSGLGGVFHLRLTGKQGGVWSGVIENPQSSFHGKPWSAGEEEMETVEEEKARVRGRFLREPDRPAAFAEAEARSRLEALRVGEAAALPGGARIRRRSEGAWEVHGAHFRDLGLAARHAARLTRHAEVTEADEAATSKAAALRNLEAQVLAGETMGVIAMFERAALAAGATMDEIEAVERAARARRGFGEARYFEPLLGLLGAAGMILAPTILRTAWRTLTGPVKDEVLRIFGRGETLSQGEREALVDKVRADLARSGDPAAREAAAELGKVFGRFREDGRARRYGADFYARTRAGRRMLVELGQAWDSPAPWEDTARLGLAEVDAETARKYAREEGEDEEAVVADVLNAIRQQVAEGARFRMSRGFSDNKGCPAAALYAEGRALAVALREARAVPQARALAGVLRAGDVAGFRDALAHLTAAADVAGAAPPPLRRRLAAARDGFLELAQVMQYQVGNIPGPLLRGLCAKWAPDAGFRTRCMASAADGGAPGLDGFEVASPGAFCNALEGECKNRGML